MAEIGIDDNFVMGVAKPEAIEILYTHCTIKRIRLVSPCT